MKTHSKPGLPYGEDPCPTIGQSVHSLSGLPLGRAVGVVENAFLMADDSQEPVWISNRAIYDSRGDNLILVCEPTGLSEYVASSPQPSAAAL